MPRLSPSLHGPIAAGFLLAASACATAGGGHLPQADSPLTAEEIAGANVASTYEAVARLRPLFLRTRGPTSILLPNPDGPAVYVDQMFVGGVEALREIPAADVRAIRYLHAWEATTSYGTGLLNGVLEVTTARGSFRAAR